MAPPPPQFLRFISDCFIKPPQLPPRSDHPLHLPPWDLTMLSSHYIQKGLLFPLPPPCIDSGSFDRPAFVHSFLEKLKRALSSALSHFYPLAGRLATLKRTDPRFYTVFIDCINSPGARFIHASLNMTMADILSPTDVPAIIHSFFDHDRAVNHDGHALSLLSVQITELADGVFMGISMNHAVGDGTSFWHFVNSWSEIFQAQEKGTVDVQLSHPPVLTRWFPENHPGPVSLPYTDEPSSFLVRYEAPELRERVFHFSANAITWLKAEANRQCGNTNISSFKSLSALVWRCITRARHLPPGQVTSCRMASNNRARLDPPLPPEYFGNFIWRIRGTATVGELLGGGLGQAAWLLHAAAAELSNMKLRELTEHWIKRPQVYRPDKTVDPYGIMIGSSPRFNIYGNEFGLGKAVALRSGYGNKIDGKVSSYPGSEGGGSVDLEICLPPATMAVLEADAEFMAAVTVS